MLRAADGQGPVVRYGWGRSWEWGAFDLQHKPGGGISCAVSRMGKVMGPLSLAVSGEHNVLNALAALAASDFLGVPFEAAAGALRDFQGAQRRLQPRGARDGVAVLDDYAHHPAEIAATLSAVRHIYPERRLVAVFQPHRYTRTAAFLEPLTSALMLADEIFLLPVYSAGESPLPFASSDSIAERINLRGRRCGLCPDLETAAGMLRAFAREGDILLTMGAGDVYRVGELFLDTR